MGLPVGVVLEAVAVVEGLVVVMVVVRMWGWWWWVVVIVVGMVVALPLTRHW